jgi:hypothetical protein
MPNDEFAHPPTPQPESPGDARAMRSGVPRQLQPGEIEMAEERIHDSPLRETHSELAGGTQDSGRTATESATQIPVIDTPETFPMAVDVRPLEKVERVPGINATEGDPPYVDPDSPTTENEPVKAHRMAVAGNGSDNSPIIMGREDAAHARGFGRETTEGGNPGVAARDFGDARLFDNDEEKGNETDASNEIEGDNFDEEALRNEFRRRWEPRLAAIQISPAYQEAHQYLGHDISTIDGLAEMVMEAYREAQEFDKNRFSNPKAALASIEKTRERIQVLADLESGVASDPDYQLENHTPGHDQT